MEQQYVYGSRGFLPRAMPELKGQNGGFGGNGRKGIDGKKDEERKALIREWENKPSPNPEFKDVTARQMARKLLRLRVEPKSKKK